MHLRSWQAAQGCPAPESSCALVSDRIHSQCTETTLSAGCSAANVLCVGQHPLGKTPSRSFHLCDVLFCSEPVIRLGLQKVKTSNRIQSDSHTTRHIMMSHNKPVINILKSLESIWRRFTSTKNQERKLSGASSPRGFTVIGASELSKTLTMNGQSK